MRAAPCGNITHCKEPANFLSIKFLSNLTPPPKKIFFFFEPKKKKKKKKKKGPPPKFFFYHKKKKKKKKKWKTTPKCFAPSEHFFLGPQEKIKILIKKLSPSPPPKI